uniref:Elongation of very long chain fatty acids protein n=1 Tax=Anopheles maculatus TaxID=74869 RepID=A0A182T8S7_9DIPT
MAQFVAIFTHQFQLLFTECNYPKGFMVWIGLHGVMFLFLFSDFYKQAYNKRVGRAKREAEALLAKSHANGKLHNGDVVNNNQGACMVCSIARVQTTTNPSHFQTHELSSVLCRRVVDNKTLHKCHAFVTASVNARRSLLNFFGPVVHPLHSNRVDARK